MLNCKQICNLGALSKIVKPLKKYSAYSTEFLRLRGRFCLRCRKIMLKILIFLGRMLYGIQFHFGYVLQTKMDENHGLTSGKKYRETKALRVRIFSANLVQGEKDEMNQRYDFEQFRGFSIESPTGL